MKQARGTLFVFVMLVAAIGRGFRWSVACVVGGGGGHRWEQRNGRNPLRSRSCLTCVMNAHTLLWKYWQVPECILN